MKYGMNEAVSEILVRSNEVKKRRERKRERMVTNFLASITLLLFGALTSVISIISINGQTKGKMTVMGAFLLPAETGGYIVVAIIAFAIGIVVTLLAFNYKRRKKREREGIN